MQTSQKNARLIGTPDYIAPEIINNLSTNNFTIDWWSLGVIAYELLVGCKPFCGESVEEVVRNIIEFRIDWPEIGEEEDMISLAAQDLISKLLSRDFVNRLGARGAWELKAHPFFKGVDWAEIKSATPPYAPKSANLINHQALAEDPKLREEIEELIGRKNGKPEARLSSRLEDSLLNNPNFKLEQFVRYDILCSETFEVVSKTVH